MKRTPLERTATLATRQALRRVAACTCAAVGDEHAFMCPARRRSRKPAKPRTRLKPRRATERRSARERDPAYLAFVRTLPCAAIGVPGHRCRGRIEADHQGDRPAGRKAHDRTAVPLCTLAHRQRADFAGPFRDWDQARMRAWLAGAIAATQSAYRFHLALAGSPGDRSVPF